MAGRIQELLNSLLTAVYGKDVRDAIHDSIAECYADVTAAKTLADESLAAANEVFNRVTTALNTLEQKLASGELDGTTPHIGENGNWYIGDEDTGIPAQGSGGGSGSGTDGITPHIGENGNWYIGDEDTNIKARGVDGADGEDGVTPHIGENGHWYIASSFLLAILRNGVE